MTQKYEVRKIKDPEFPWAVFENLEIIGRFVSHELAVRAMKVFADYE